MKKTTELELVGPDTGLTKEQLVQANELHTKFPAIVQAYKKVKEQENNLKGKWITLCERLREPGQGVTLNSREMTLILRALGEPKSRVSEIIRVVSVDDKVWAQYKAQVIGFRAVLQLARGKPADTAEELASEEASENGTDAEAKHRPVYRTLPESMAELIRAATETHKGELVPTGKGFYALSLLFQHGDHGRKVVIRIEVDDVAKS